VNAAHDASAGGSPPLDPAGGGIGFGVRGSTFCRFWVCSSVRPFGFRQFVTSTIQQPKPEQPEQKN
jgi:hypothetical protein